MADRNQIIFLLRVVPFFVLLVYFILEGRGRLGVDGAAREVASDTPQRLAEIGGVQEGNTENRNIVEMFVQVAVTAGDWIHLPASIIALGLSGSALLVAELMRIPKDIEVSIFEVLTINYYHLGLLVFLYAVLIVAIAGYTWYSFRGVDAGQYYDQQRSNSGEVTISTVISGNNSFKEWYRIIVKSILIPSLYILTLLLVLGIHFGT